MDTWYWALEYVRVFFAYVMILFVWPSVVFRDYLRGRSRTVRFAFCVTVPVVLLNTVVLSLGVFHILYGWLIAVLFYGTLLLGLLRWHPVRREQIKKISRLFLGTYGIRLLLLRLRNRVKDGIGHVHAQFRQSMVWSCALAWCIFPTGHSMITPTGLAICTATTRGSTGC